MTPLGNWDGYAQFTLGNARQTYIQNEFPNGVIDQVATPLKIKSKIFMIMSVVYVHQVPDRCEPVEESLLESQRDR
jgi:hypothetical protein